MHCKVLVRFFKEDFFLSSLSVVIAIVVSFVGDALKSLLDNRQQIILANIDEADKQAVEINKKLDRAKKQSQSAYLKVQQISKQVEEAIKKDQTYLQEQTNQIVQRLESLKQESLNFQQQKALKNLSIKVIQLSLKQVEEKLQSRVDSLFQKSVNSFYISLLRNYPLFNQK